MRTREKKRALVGRKYLPISTKHACTLDTELSLRKPLHRNVKLEELVRSPLHLIQNKQLTVGRELYPGQLTNSLLSS